MFQADLMFLHHTRVSGVVEKQRAAFHEGNTQTLFISQVCNILRSFLERIKITWHWLHLKDWMKFAGQEPGNFTADVWCRQCVSHLWVALARCDTSSSGSSPACIYAAAPDWHCSPHWSPDRSDTHTHTVIINNSNRMKSCELTRVTRCDMWNV